MQEYGRERGGRSLKNSEQARRVSGYKKMEPFLPWPSPGGGFQQATEMNE